MFRNRLPTSTNVAKRNGPSDGNCSLCGSPEDANHTLFHCHLAIFAWSTVREAVRASWNPKSCADLLACLASLQGSAMRIMWTCVGALLWSLCYIHNKTTIEGVFSSHSADCIFKCTIFLQQWSPLRGRQDVEDLELALQRLRHINRIVRVPVDAA